MSHEAALEDEYFGGLDKEAEKLLSDNNSKSESHTSHSSLTGAAQGVPSSQQGHKLSHDTKKNTLKESKIAEEIAKTIENKLAYDEVQGEWYLYKKNIWKEITDKTARRIINKKLSERFNQGFTLSFLRNMEGFMQMYLYADEWQTNKSLLPVNNGVLDLKTKIIKPHAYNHYFRWCLPFDFQPKAKCPTIMKWLKASTYDDEETIQVIRCCFYLALIGSKQIQKFLELLGAGGTGKSTLIRLLIMLLGEQNHVATDLKNLEGNRFEAAILYSKKLVVISDSSRYGGELSVLKAVTGGDPIRLEKKNKQQGGSFVADCFVVIASNEAIQSSDYSSGLTRRRIPVNFNRRVTEEDKALWRDQGGIEAVMEKELPGLLNWVLELTESEANKILGGLNGFMTKSERLHYVETNKLAAWLDDRCIVDESKGTYTGGSFKSRDEEVAHDIKTKLYPNYQDWCEENAVKALAVQRFGNSLDDICQTLKLPVKREDKDRHGRQFTGLVIRDFLHIKTPTPVTKTILCDGK